MQGFAPAGLFFSFKGCLGFIMSNCEALVPGLFYLYSGFCYVLQNGSLLN